MEHFMISVDFPRLQCYSGAHPLGYHGGPPVLILRGALVTTSCESHRLLKVLLSSISGDNTASDQSRDPNTLWL